MIDHLRRRGAIPAVVVAISLALAACGSSGSASTGSSNSNSNGSQPHASTGTLVKGGTAYWAEQPESPPNYIFPLISGEYYSNENVNDFQTLLYRPLYWYGDRDNPKVDYSMSLADAPVYSDHDRVVTITLKHDGWSDGETVSARDVVFWINLLKADRGDWASYVPGGFPDNVVSYIALGERTVRLTLNRSYNPTWFTDNELSQITPLPLAWDRTSTAGCTAHSCPVPKTLPDTTTQGAKAVYAFLNSESKHLSGYASSPIWSTVDGAWKLTQLTSDGQATFIPNRSYTGPDRPRLAKFVELPYTSETAEFSVLRTGTTSGDTASNQPQISVGYVPDTDLPQASSLSSDGYRLTSFYPYGFDYMEPNFNNPTVGPIFKQLYFRQAFQHLIDQPGWIHAYYDKLGVPTYSPVPAKPANPYADSEASSDPYPFSIAAARKLLTAHGWKIVAGGVSTCARPGTASGDCGAGIKRNQALRFTLTYPTGMSSTDNAMVDLQSVARQVGIVLTLKEVTTATVDAEIEPCKPSQSACDWEIGQYGTAWVFAPDHYPSGEEIFQTGALGNVGSYSAESVDRLIEATETSTSTNDERSALNAYANTVRKLLPDFWQPSPGTLITTQSNLAGMVPNAYGFISPEEWYFTK